MIPLESGTVSLYPYPHIVIPNALPWDAYHELLESFPEDLILSGPHEENQRIDVHARDRDKLPDAWKVFVEEHLTETFWEKVLGQFGDVIRFYYPMAEVMYGPIETWSVGVRGQDKATVSLDCQPGINTPQTAIGRVRGPHLDNPIELFGAMLYMGSGDGDLLVQKYVKQPTFYGKLEIHDECVQTVATVPYEHNMFMMFLNTPCSIHAVTPRRPTTLCRKLVNFIGEMPQPLFKVGHGRY